MESLIQTHCGPPVVFIHIIDTFTFCFCLLSWIIFYLPEVNFFMTTAHFSLFFHGPIALVCMWMFVLEIRLKSIQPVHLCTVYMHICLLNILFDVNSYDWMLLGNHVKDSNLSEVNHISVFWKRKKKLAEISSPSILHHISWYHDARIHTKLCNKKQNPKKWWWCHENLCMLIFVKLTLSNQFS